MDTVYDEASLGASSGYVKRVTPCRRTDEPSASVMTLVSPSATSTVVVLGELGSMKTTDTAIRMSATPAASRQAHE